MVYDCVYRPAGRQYPVRQLFFYKEIQPVAKSQVWQLRQSGCLFRSMTCFTNSGISITIAFSQIRIIRLKDDVVFAFRVF